MARKAKIVLWQIRSTASGANCDKQLSRRGNTSQGIIQLSLNTADESRLLCAVSRPSILIQFVFFKIFLSITVLVRLTQKYFDKAIIRLHLSFMDNNRSSGATFKTAIT